MEQSIRIVRVSAKLEGGEKNENTREPNIQEVPEPRAQQYIHDLPLQILCQEESIW